MDTIPLIETKRLILRHFEEQDAWDMYLLNSDPMVLRFTGDHPFKSVPEARDFILNYRQYEMNGYGRWTVILKETGEYIG